jgi:hypothetical protein
VIISASYKTDIPAFYGDWFLNRLHAGYCKILNPYNARISRVPLDKPSVDGIVFWTKNAGPFLPHLEAVASLGFPFVVQYTINGYPRALESAVIDAVRSIRHVRHISETFGPRVPVWRYDTIVISTLTPTTFHLENFTRIAQQLEGAVDEVVISFMHLYDKTRRNLARAATERGFDWHDPTAEEKRELVSRLVSIARTHEIRLSICSQPTFVVDGAVEARCVDADRLEALAGSKIKARLHGNRKQCGCFESRDIGEYNTCPQGCVYCYAVVNTALAKERFSLHDPNSEFLFAPPPWAKESEPERERAQLPLI